MAKMLVAEYGADMESKLVNGSQASHTAASRGNLEVLEVLLDLGARIDATNNDGRTPLHFAAESGHWECVRHLLDRGAKTELLADDQGLTALDMAHLGINGATRYYFPTHPEDKFPDAERDMLLARLGVKQ